MFICVISNTRRKIFINKGILEESLKILKNRKRNDFIFSIQNSKNKINTTKKITHYLYC